MSSSARAFSRRSAARDAAQAQRELDVAAGGQPRHERRLLEHHRGALAGGLDVPGGGLSSPAMRLSSVDLPHPDAPRRQTNSPGAMSRSMSVEHERAVAEALADALDAHRGSGARRGGRDRLTLSSKLGTEQVGRRARPAASAGVARRHRRRVRRGSGHGQSSPSPAAETGSSPAASRMPLSRRRSNRPSIEPSFCVPAARPFATRVSKVSACGSTEKVTCSSARAMTASASGLPVSASMRVVDHRGRLVGVVGDPLHGGDVALEQVLDDVGVLLEELRAHEQHGGRELAVLPQLGLVDQHVRAGVEDQPRHPRLRQPRAVDLALLEQGERLGVLGRRDADIAAARRVGLEALVGEPGAQRHVLRVAELRRSRASCPPGRPACRCRRARRAPHHRSPLRR